MIKGIIVGIFNLLFLGIISWLFYRNLEYSLWNMCFYFWVAFFSTMSFSGYTFSTGPREIDQEYALFRPLNMTLLILGLVLSTLGIIFTIVLPLF